MKKVYTSIAYEEFDKYLDTFYPTTVIGEYEYKTSSAFKKVSPVSYQEDFEEFCRANDIELE